MASSSTLKQNVNGPIALNVYLYIICESLLNNTFTVILINTKKIELEEFNFNV